MTTTKTPTATPRSASTKTRCASSTGLQTGRSRLAPANPTSTASCSVRAAPPSPSSAACWTTAPPTGAYRLVHQDWGEPWRELYLDADSDEILGDLPADLSAAIKERAGYLDTLVRTYIDLLVYAG